MSYRGYLDNITAIGPRTVGSPENEVLAVNYLLEQIRGIERESTDAHKISVDIQRPTGSFSIDFLGGFTSYYANITNVVVKLEPRSGAEHAVLSNCHFDSVPNTPGRSVCLFRVSLCYMSHRAWLVDFSYQVATLEYCMCQLVCLVSVKFIA